MSEGDSSWPAGGLSDEDEDTPVGGSARRRVKERASSAERHPPPVKPEETQTEDRSDKPAEPLPEAKDPPDSSAPRKNDAPTRKRRSGWSSVPDADKSTRRNSATGGGFSGPALGQMDAGGVSTYLPALNAGESALATSRLHLLGQQLGLNTTQMKAARELIICNIPPGVNVSVLVDFLNASLIAMKGNCLPGNPAVKGVIMQDQTYAIVEFRTMEEANNAMTLNGINCFGYRLKLGRPKTYPESLLNVPAAQQITMPPTSGVIAGILSGVSSTTTVNKELLGPAFSEAISRQSSILISSTGLVVPPPDSLCIRKFPPPHIFSEDRAREFLTAFGPLRFFVFFGLPSVVEVRRSLSNHIALRSATDQNGYPLPDVQLKPRRVRTRFDQETKKEAPTSAEDQVKVEVSKEEDKQTDTTPKTLAETCVDEILAMEPVESVCVFEYHYNLDSQNLTRELETLTLSGCKPEVESAEVCLASDDFLMFIVYSVMARKCFKTLHEAHVPLPIPTRVLYIENAVSPEELLKETDCNEIIEDIRLECKKHGRVVSILLPRPKQEVTESQVVKSDVAIPLKPEENGSKSDPSPPPAPPAGSVEGVGFVFVEFATVVEACKARKALNGRKFSNRAVRVEWFGEELYANKKLDKPAPNIDPQQSTTNCPQLANHVPALVKQIEEMERLGREAARQAATAAANATFGGQAQLGLPPPPMPALMNVARPDFDEDVVKDEEAMEEDE